MTARRIVIPWPVVRRTAAEGCNSKALAMNPEMLFFDEPTSALDPEITAGILKVLRQLADVKDDNDYCYT